MNDTVESTRHSDKRPKEGERIVRQLEAMHTVYVCRCHRRADRGQLVPLRRRTPAMIWRH